jgi:hypothetical protein
MSLLGSASGKNCSQAYDGEGIHRFLQARLLHWLEAFGWMGKILKGIHAILSLKTFFFIRFSKIYIYYPIEVLLTCLRTTESPNLHAFIHNAKRFALYNRSIIEQVPLQLYCSTLVFAPESSFVRENLNKCIPG